MGNRLKCLQKLSSLVLRQFTIMRCIEILWRFIFVVKMLHAIKVTCFKISRGCNICDPLPCDNYACLYLQVIIMQQQWPWNMFNHVIFIWTSWCTERPYQFGNIALGLSMTQGWLIYRKMIHNRYEYRYMSLINSLSRVPNVRFVQKCTFALIRVFDLKISVLIADWSNFYCYYWSWIEVEYLQNEKLPDKIDKICWKSILIGQI